jgi:Glycosyl transferase family 2
VPAAESPLPPRLKSALHRPTTPVVLSGLPAPALPARASRGAGDYPAHGTSDHAWTNVIRAWREELGAPAVTGIVHTFNEERHVVEALRSLAWTDELIVVDMHSTDRTCEISRESGARVVEHEHLGYVEPARNFGHAQASSEWIVVLDADEWMEPELAVALTAFTLEPSAEAVELPFRNFLCGRWLGGTGWGDEYHLRFFRKGAVHWPERVHALPEVRGPVVRLARLAGTEVLHHNYDDLTEFVAKLNVYTGREAETLARSDAPSSWEAATAAARAEIAARWQPQIDGTHSIVLSMAMLFYRFLAHAKRWENEGFPDVGAPTDARAALRDLATGAGPRHARALDDYAGGRVGDAERELRGLVADAIGREVLNDLAVVLVAQRRVEEARHLLHACLVLFPGDVDARENLRLLDTVAAEAA